MQSCGRKFLYEVVAPSILYLTIDNNNPIYVGFQHKIKLEVCLINNKQNEPDEQDIHKDTPSTGILSPSNLRDIEKEKVLLVKPDIPFTERTAMPAFKRRQNDLPLIDENMGREKRRKPVLSIDFQKEIPIVKRSERAHTRSKRHLSSNTENEKTTKRRKEDSMKLSTFRVSDVSLKSATWKLEKTMTSRANRAAKNQATVNSESENNIAGGTCENIVSCKFCFRAFPTKLEFFDHHKIINPPNYICEICNACFPFKAYLFVHMKYHTANKTDIYRCDICGLDTKNSTGMKRHVIKHTNEKCYKCCVCGKESFDFGTSKMHLMTHYTKNNKKERQGTESGSQGLGLVAVTKQGQEIDYTCLYCAQTFTSKYDFFNHTRILNQQTYSCEICGLKFALQAFLLAHMKIHQEDKDSGKLYTCEDCGLDAKTPTRLKRHMLTHTNEKCYKCCVCFKESPHYGSAKLHLMTHEKKVKPAEGPGLKSETVETLDQPVAAKELDSDSKNLFCDVCNQTFETKKEFINHNKISNPLIHKCEECGTAFPYRAYLLVHMKSHRKDKLNGTLYYCDECGLNAKNTTRLKRHMITHTKEQCFKCCICPKTSSCFSTAQKHLMYHRRNGMLRCTCCNTDFPNRQALASHQLAVMNIKCELCGLEFPNRTSRTLHLKSEHSQQILKCDMCLRVYTNQKEFDNHMAYHENNRKKQCPVCGKFVSRMNKHLLSHRTLQEMDESELWMCHKCPMKFKLKSSFIRHLASHSEERNFHCHLCPKAFTSGSELGRHLRRHSSLTPHQCQECGKWFRERRNLKCHMLVHSDSKVFQCTLCPQGFNYKSSLEGHLRSKHAHGTEQQQYLSERQVMMPHPEQLGMPHQAMAQDQITPSVMPLHPTAPMAEFIMY